MRAAKSVAGALLGLAGVALAAFSSSSPESWDRMLECKRSDSEECRGKMGGAPRNVPDTRALLRSGNGGAAEASAPEHAATRDLQTAEETAKEEDQRAACARILECKECLAPSSGCFGWLGTWCCDKLSCEAAVEGDQHFYTSCDEWEKAQALSEVCSAIPNDKPCDCLEAGCIAQEVGKATACFSEFQSAAGRGISAEECKAYEKAQHDLGLGAAPSTTSSSAAEISYCPGSEEQKCDTVCFDAECPPGHCMARLDGCCELTCKPLAINTVFDQSTEVEGAVEANLCAGAQMFPCHKDTPCPTPTCEPGLCAQPGGPGTCCEWYCQPMLHKDDLLVEKTKLVEAVPCPDSPEQLCKKLCPEPKCPEFHCANRSDDCCEWTCESWTPLGASAVESLPPWVKGSNCSSKKTCEACLEKDSGCYGWQIGDGCCELEAECHAAAQFGDRAFFTSCEAWDNATSHSRKCSKITDACKCLQEDCYPQQIQQGQFLCFGSPQSAAGRLIKEEECKEASSKVPKPPSDPEEEKDE